MPSAVLKGFLLSGTAAFTRSRSRRRGAACSLSGVPDGHCDQRRSGAGDSALRCNPDHLRDPVSCRISVSSLASWSSPALIVGTRYLLRLMKVVVPERHLARPEHGSRRSSRWSLLCSGWSPGSVGISFAERDHAVYCWAECRFHITFTGPGRSIALLATAAATVATGWAASFRVLGQKPLEVLREEWSASFLQLRHTRL